MGPFLIFAGISAALAVASTAIQVSAANAAANAEKSAVQTQSLENQYKITKAKTKEANQALNYLHTNEAVAINRGEALNSPSFNAIQVSTLQNAQKALQADTTFQEVNTLETEAKKQSIDTQKDYQVAGSLIGGASKVTSSFSTANALSEESGNGSIF